MSPNRRHRWTSSVVISQETTCPSASRCRPPRHCYVDRESARPARGPSLRRSHINSSSHREEVEGVWRDSGYHSRKPSRHVRPRSQTSVSGWAFGRKGSYERTKPDQTTVHREGKRRGIFGSVDGRGQLTAPTGKSCRCLLLTARDSILDA